MLELYNASISTCSQKVRMVLFEKDLPWTDHQISFQKADHLSDWYLRLNPNGVVPTLLHDGDAIIDSSVINEYLEDVFAASPLRPANAKERARMRAWRHYIDEVPTPAIRVPSFHLVLRKIWSDEPEEFDLYAERLPLRKHFYKKMRTGGFSDEDLQEAMDKLGQTVARMDAALADAGPWLMGSMFTLADVSIMPTIVRLEDLGLDHVWAKHRHVGAWYERLQARPAFARVYTPAARALSPAC